MENFLIYLFKTALGLAVVYLFYFLILKSLTFYRWNRYYLATAPLIALLIPFADLSSYLPAYSTIRWKMSDDTNSVQSVVTLSSETVHAEAISWTITEWISYIIITGAAFMLCKLLIRYASIKKLQQKAVLLKDGEHSIYQVNDKIMPFSFGNSIYINAQRHELTELSEIIRHESVHVKQKHSYDIIWAELLCVVNWFNPFAWLIRHDIRQNLEYIADDELIKTGTNKISYQYLLLKVTGYPINPIGINFSFSSLKKRIAMINKIKSPAFNRYRFLLVIPMLAIVLFAFNENKKTSESKKVVMISEPVLQLSDSAVIFRNGIPVAISKDGYTATFTESMFPDKSDYKILAFGKLMSAEEVNKRYKRSEFTMVAAGEKPAFTETLGINENLLILDTIQGNPFVKPSPLLRGKIIK